MTENKTQSFRELPKRFLDKIGAPDNRGCRNWIAAKFSTGYGAFQYEGRPRRAHRIIWEFSHGPIPNGLFVLHKCDNPACVNIEHLWLGSNQENMDDKVSKGRQTRNGGGPFGEMNKNAKLTAGDILQIRAARAAGVNQYHLADKYGVSQTTICRIVNGRAWRRVA